MGYVGIGELHSYPVHEDHEGMLLKSFKLGYGCDGYGGVSVGAFVPRDLYTFNIA